jgi:chromosome segregation ATPase
MSSGVSLDEFQALEQRVLRAVEIVRQEREARATAEAETARLRDELAAEKQRAESDSSAANATLETVQAELAAVRSEMDVLYQERDVVKQRVERLLTQMDELG